jgi:hypothetical protein
MELGLVGTIQHTIWCGLPWSIVILESLLPPEETREGAAAPSNIKEIQEIQRGQEAPLDGDAINPKDA